MVNFRKKKGFTLIELIIALALLAIVLGIAYSIYFFNAKTYASSGRQSDIQGSIRLASGQISREVREAQSMTLLSATDINTLISANSFDVQKKYIYVKDGMIKFNIGGVEKSISGQAIAGLTLALQRDATQKILGFNITGTDQGNSFNVQSQVLIQNIGNGYISGTSGIAVTFGPLTDQEAVDVDAAALSLPASTTTNLVLPSAGANGTYIMWDNSGSSYISTTGVVVRPPITDPTDATVILTATISLNGRTTTRTFTVVVPRVQQISIADAAMPAAVVGSAYSYTLSATDGDGIYSYTITGLPLGLTYTTNTTTHIATISGTPTAASYPGSDASISVTASDGTGSDTATFTLRVYPAIIFTSTSPLPAGTKMYTYSNQLVASDTYCTPNTYSITTGALPAGLSLSSSGLINGTPTVTGTFNFTVKVNDSIGRASTNAFALTINKQTVSSTASLVDSQSTPPSKKKNTNFAFNVTVKDTGNLIISGLTAASFAITADQGVPNDLTLAGVAENGTTGVYTVTASFKTAGTIHITVKVDGVTITSGTVTVVLTNN